MSFNVNYDDLLVMECTACSLTSDWSEKCGLLKETITALINTQGLQGQGIDNIRNYLSSVHYVILTTIETVITEYNLRFLLCARLL